MDDETLKELRFAACASSVDIPGPLLQRLVSEYDAKTKRVAELEAEVARLKAEVARGR